ncbi:MAG: hypothetical protein P4L31_01695, partial [Candidatus Babeliales bacterium]|nr:hypothetical protein [Candidatus Babeliales bacterium]
EMSGLSYKCLRFKAVRLKENHFSFGLSNKEKIRQITNRSWSISMEEKLRRASEWYKKEAGSFRHASFSCVQVLSPF